MKYLLCSILLLSICSCGRKPQDNAFIPYLDLWSRVYDRDSGNIEIAFADVMPQPNTVGVCINREKILIQRTYWDKTNEANRTELIFHEMGHCELKLDHDNRINPIDHCPETYMYPYVIGKACWDLRYNWYI